MGSNQQYVNARYIVSVPRVGFEPISLGKIQGSTIELQRQTQGSFEIFGHLNHPVNFLKPTDITHPALMMRDLRFSLNDEDLGFTSPSIRDYLDITSGESGARTHAPMGLTDLRR